MAFRSLPSVFLALVLAVSSGCSSMYSLLRADPPRQESFMDARTRFVEQAPDFPFRMMWIDRNVDLGKYRNVILAKVNLDHLSDSSGWDKVDTRRLAGDLKDDAREIAEYMEKSFWNAIVYDPKHRLRVVGTPGPDTLRLELALIQLVPSKAELNIVENIVGIVIWPVAFLTVFNSGTTSFEGVLRDSQTGRIVFAFADREKDEAAILNLPGFSYYGNARYFTDRWSRQFVEFMNAEDYTKLKTDFPFKLIVF